MDASVRNTVRILVLLLAGGVVHVPVAGATPSIPPEGAGLPPAAVEAPAPSTQGVTTNLQTVASLVGLEETGSVKPNYGSITVDSGGLTYGAYQNNTISGRGVGSLPGLLSAYVAAGGQYAAQIKQFAPYYRRSFGRVTNVANLKGLEAVLRQAASDPIMQKLQQQSWDKQYLVPAMEAARANGVTSPFGVALFTDIETNGGLASVVRAAKAQVPVVSNPAQEKQFLDAMIAARQHRYQVLASRPAYAKYLAGWTSRTNDFKSVLAHNGTGMVGTLNVTARGGRIPGGTAADAAAFASFVKELPTNQAQALAAVEARGVGLGGPAVATAPAPEEARKPAAGSAPAVATKPATSPAATTPSGSPGNSPMSVTVTVTFGPATATSSGALANAPSANDPSLTSLIAALTQLLASLQQAVNAINQGLPNPNGVGNNSPASGNNSPIASSGPGGGSGSPSGGAGSPTSNGGGTPITVASNNGPMGGPAGIGSSPASPSGSGTQVGRNAPTTPTLTSAAGSTVALHAHGNPHGGVGWVRNSSSLGGN